MQYRGVQLLRGVAAMMVVLLHVGTMVAERNVGRVP